MNSLVEANTNFAVDLLKWMEKKHSTENIFFSPFNITAALSMVHLGSRGNTADEMGKVLHFDKITGSQSSTDLLSSPAQCDKPGGPHNQFKELLAAINQPTNNYTLSTANRLYASNIYEFRQQYLQCSKDLYHAELERVDFENAAEAVRKQINSWVESQTNGKITDLFPKGSITRATVLTLVAAIYFKGKWKTEFDPSNTHEADFWITKDRSKKVQMMSQRGKFNLARIANPAMRVLEFPYDKEGLSMFILLPDHKGATDEIVRQLTSAKLQEWTSSTSMENTEMRVFLPKFKMEAAYPLISILREMGMNDVFISGKADLSGMSENNDLVVSEVLHKSYIEVNEEGTEAAAATGAVVVVTSAPIIPEFKVDSPVIFLIRHNPTKSILFVGKVSSP